jgi:short-subunit dehydrogenase
VSDRHAEVVVVTGASGGVGRATVREFASHGARIGLLARNLEALEAAKREVEALGGEALVVPTDVGHEDQVEAAAAAVEKHFGPIDVWINNAMVSIFGPFLQLSPAEYRHITEVTYLGQVWGTMAALKRMLPRDRGTIVQIGSALAHRSIPLQAAYCGAKHAIIGFTESVRTELIHMKSHVHLTVVNLPGMNTTQFTWTRNKMPHKPRPVGTIFQPEVAADAIYFAAHHRRKEMSVGWPTLEAVTVEKFASVALDEYLAETAWEGSQGPEENPPGAPDNFWKPVQGDRGAHGPFDQQAKNFSAQTWVNKHRGWVGFAGAVAAIAALSFAGRAGRRHKSSKDRQKAKTRHSPPPAPTGAKGGMPLERARII